MIKEERAFARCLYDFKTYMVEVTRCMSLTSCKIQLSVTIVFFSFFCYESDAYIHSKLVTSHQNPTLTTVFSYKHRLCGASNVLENPK